MTELHLGFDDTDSQEGMCTTYVVSKIIEELGLEPHLLGYPELIRLNPTIPWKTRGNGAIALRLKLEGFDIDSFKKNVVELVEEYRESSSNSGIVFFEKDPREIDEIRNFSKKAVKEIVSVQKARELAKKHGVVKEFGNGQGVVGGVCAAGYVFSDYTFELIGYRKKERWGEKRDLDKESVKKISREKHPEVWDTFDWKNEELVLSPNTPCPVLYGVRGDSKRKIKESVDLLEGEEAVLHQLFKTNQGTDEHLQVKDSISKIKPYTSVVLEGVVSDTPRTIEGGHVIFSIEDDDGETIDCAAYEPTKGFRNKVKRLIQGDRVKVMGGVRKKPLTINLEKIEIIELSKDIRYKNPVCPECGNRMESAGREQGYRCRRCKTRAEEKVEIKYERELNEDVFEVPPTARRHLSKPIVREVNYPHGLP